MKSEGTKRTFCNVLKRVVNMYACKVAQMKGTWDWFVCHVDAKSETFTSTWPICGPACEIITWPGEPKR